MSEIVFVLVFVLHTCSDGMSLHLSVVPRKRIVRWWEACNFLKISMKMRDNVEVCGARTKRDISDCYCWTVPWRCTYGETGSGVSTGRPCKQTDIYPKRNFSVSIFQGTTIWNEVFGGHIFGGSSIRR